MKRSTLALMILVAAVGAAIAVAVSILHNGMSARAAPTALETMMARSARHMSIPEKAREAVNPVANSPEIQHEARLHFADHCAVCHGNSGDGDTMLGRGLYPKPPDLKQSDTQKLSDGELFWIIENGVRFTGMPAFAGHGSEEDSWKLALFIHHLPQLTPEEGAEMARYNPRGPDERKEDQQEDDFLNGGKAPQDSATHHH